MKHVHHDMIVEWAADTSRVVQSRRLDHHEWTVDPYPPWLPQWQYRFKPAEPKYIVVNGVNVPEPVREPPKCNPEYWIAWATAEDAKPARIFWGRTTEELRWLSLGIIHLTKEAAQTHIDAMLLPLRTDK